MIIKLVQSYQNTVLGSREFKLHLLEIAAVAVHNISADLFPSCSHDTQLLKPDYKPLPSQPTPPLWPTRLRHRAYDEYGINPLGIAGMVAHWVEVKVLDAYLHPKYPYMFFELSDKQIDDFAAFGTHSPNPNHNHSTSSLLPIATERYALRVDLESAIQMYIYLR
ncbi:hypothetical protein TESG_03100 [Trichophyton tonsurans CBS 112818]|uniref:Uncharacterized protein n=1 Tax=Trichophyton tonsurans (strain CBS 112818) TaxID=647933 RepID=F2RWF5_TRIT1|nr:hypothetical protein TESG_03100 [Trichophyton tonsurans CBS 112818]